MEPFMKQRVGDLAVGRAGDKGDVLDLTLVACNDEAYGCLVQRLDEATLMRLLSGCIPGPIQRHLVPGLRALKFVAPRALPGGVYASLHPGLHWQKAAIWLLLDLWIDSDGVSLPSDFAHKET
jgi:hypothetical protein